MLSKLTSAISVKQKLVDELVEKQRYARRLTEQYDDQLNYLKQGIQSVQKRRDQELSKLGISWQLLIIFVSDKHNVWVCD